VSSSQNWKLIIIFINLRTRGQSEHVAGEVLNNQIVNLKDEGRVYEGGSFWLKINFIYITIHTKIPKSIQKILQKRKRKENKTVVNWGGGAVTSVPGPFFYSCVIFVSEGKAPMHLSLFCSLFFPDPSYMWTVSCLFYWTHVIFNQSLDMLLPLFSS